MRKIPREKTIVFITFDERQHVHHHLDSTNSIVYMIAKEKGDHEMVNIGI